MKTHTRCVVRSILFLLLQLLPAYPSLLFALQLVVEEEEGLLIRLWRPNDREHALARVIVRFLGNADLRTRETTDLRDFRTVAANDATDHVRRNGDVLRPQIAGLGRGRAR